MKYKLIVLLIAMMGAGQFQADAQVFERTRHEHEAFRVYENTKLEVYNKYGNIHLFTWNVDSVRIDIDLKVRASKESKVEKIFEYIDFEFSNSKYYIIARTNFRQNQGSFWSELSDLANTVFSGNNKAQIDYHIYLPADMAVKLENKFGNIYCTDLAGKVDVKLSNGDFKANDLTGDTDLDLSFGSAAINHIKGGSIQGSYLDLELSSFEQLKVTSKSSTYKIGEGDVLYTDSRRDKFYIDGLTTLSGKTSFTYLALSNLSGALQLETDYGEVKLKGIQPSYSIIDLNAKYTDIILEIGAGMSASVDISYTETTGLYYPESYTALTITEPGEKGEPLKITGTIGDDSKQAGALKIVIQSGKIALQEEIQLF